MATTEDDLPPALEERVRDIVSPIIKARIENIRGRAARDPHYRWPALDMKALFQDVILPQLLIRKPSMTKEEFIEFIDRVWPSAHGPGAEPTFDSELVRTAHDELVKGLGWSSDDACSEIADRLSTTKRTIQKYISQPSTPHSRKNS